jgi:beta-ribofuranosylaminobenzene 5'-phosphate synthase
VAHHPLPANWRFVVAVPEGKGTHGEEEERSMRRVVGENEAIAEDVRREFVARVLPGAAGGNLSSFGAGVEEIDRLNGEWYSDSGEQGGVYDEASAGVIERFKRTDEVAGAGQSSWGPAAYALTTEENADEVAASVEERTHVSSPDNGGARLSLLR